MYNVTDARSGFDSIDAHWDTCKDTMWVFELVRDVTYVIDVLMKRERQINRLN